MEGQMRLYIRLTMEDSGFHLHTSMDNNMYNLINVTRFPSFDTSARMRFGVEGKILGFPNQRNDRLKGFNNMHGSYQHSADQKEKVEKKINSYHMRERKMETQNDVKKVSLEEDLQKTQNDVKKVSLEEDLQKTQNDVKKVSLEEDLQKTQNDVKKAYSFPNNCFASLYNTREEKEEENITLRAKSEEMAREMSAGTIVGSASPAMANDCSYAGSSSGDEVRPGLLGTGGRRRARGREVGCFDARPGSRKQGGAETDSFRLGRLRERESKGGEGFSVLGLPSREREVEKSGLRRTERPLLWLRKREK
ncbi:hypothetical protein M5K25_003215 [Dendrobium thyrsiflorum]|uniref:Uncharacterized protein n=1 Tax=Dendrobium thyrsiflorum TaxID=117978 RepID=A0ABD0VPE9_DENTH